MYHDDIFLPALHKLLIVFFSLASLPLSQWAANHHSGRHVPRSASHAIALVACGLKASSEIEAARVSSSTNQRCRMSERVSRREGA